MTNAYAYNITVRRDVFDGEMLFEARVKELPDVAEYGDTYEEAYSLAVETIELAGAMMAEQGKEMPAPYAPSPDYSGRVTLRVPRTLHRAIAEAAEDEGVSLNQHIVNVLGYYSGYANAERNLLAGVWRPAALIKSPAAGRVLKLVRSKDLAAEAA